MSKKYEFIAVSRLKTERGWSDKAIEQLLGTCDKEAPNPHYRQGAPMCLYLLSRVKRRERTKAFQRFREQKARRSVAAQKATDKRKAELLAQIADLPIQVPKIKNYVHRACRHYNELWESREEFDKHATTKDSKAFLQRISVNFLRHELSDYEDQLYTVFGKIGADAARSLIRDRILDQIAKVYPELSAECARQKRDEDEYPSDIPRSVLWG